MDGRGATPDSVHASEHGPGRHPGHDALQEGIDPVALAQRDAGRRPPGSAVLGAFGVRTEDLRRLPGGQQTTWTDGRLVLKRAGFAPEHAWVCDIYERWRAHDRVRVPEPVRPLGSTSSVDGAWTVDGWAAHVFVTGRDAELLRDIERVRGASDAFHEAIAELERPGFVDLRTDPWAFGDRLAWEDAAPAGGPRTLRLAERLRAVLAPVDDAEQVIHGDILPNVLLAEDRPPAVIDWPPYVRPRAFALAIAATDAVTFRGAAAALFDRWATGPSWDQLLVRAVLYRLGPTGYFEARRRLMGSLVTHVERAEPVADELLRRIASR